ncbi:hypothetical protein [Pelagerythrobacter aerophilus]|uniref:Uncharacterized protein n=1 Tax=Pelagerythrobacter aerophilus TaxID=2306995 RepID=A0A418NJR0_9SPHN|nr:hypothetical protein [Pelagerythrobacter aerophilus]RIV79535.1 hypothetical protein D2V04_06075 [Pelagerythrobacter aerophilus]
MTAPVEVTPIDLTDEDEVLDLLTDCISESFDVDWTARDGARHVLGGLQHEGIALVRTTQCSGVTQLAEFHELLGRFGLLLTDDPEFDHDDASFGEAQHALISALRTTHSPSEAEECAIPPEGWRCTRAPGHEGPCAAIPATDDKLVDLIRDWMMSGDHPVSKWERDFAAAIRATLPLPSDKTVDGARCYDCGRPYGDEHGFPDLLVPREVWNEKLSPVGHEGGLLCPSCLCKAAHDAGVKCSAVFTSGPFVASDKTVELLREAREDLRGLCVIADQFCDDAGLCLDAMPHILDARETLAKIDSHLGEMK